MSANLRDTDYATVLKEVELIDPNGSGDTYKAERLRIKDLKTEEIRFSWWKNGNIVPRPLDLEADVWGQLLKLAIDGDVLPYSLIKALRSAVA